MNAANPVSTTARSVRRTGGRSDIGLATACIRDSKIPAPVFVSVDSGRSGQ